MTSIRWSGSARFAASYMLTALLGLTAAGGCGKAADEANAGLLARGPADGSYQIRYLSPPWRFAEQLGNTLRIEIPRAGDLVIPADAGIMTIPKYRLIADVVDGTPSENSDSRQPPSGALDVVSRQSFETYEGVVGVELGWRDPETDLNKRIVLLPHVAGTLAIEVTAFPALFVEEMTDMLRSVSVRTAER